MRTLLILSLFAAHVMAQGATPAPTAVPIPQGQSGPLVRQIATPHNVMPHLVRGVGLVTGLQGTGASDRVTRQAVKNYIQQHGLKVPDSDVGAGNTALVSLAAEIPPFAKQGAPLNVHVQMISDGVSLRGGYLEMAYLMGVDGLEQAVVQGAIDPGGFAVEGNNASVAKGVTTSGNVTTGGRVIRDMTSSYFSESGALEMRLNRSSNTMAAALADTIKETLALQPVKVYVVDPSLVRIEMPVELQTHDHAVRMLGKIGSRHITVDNPSSITIDQTTGVVTAGEGIYISPCVVALSDVTISVVEDQDISQPQPFSPGETRPINRTRIDINTSSTPLKPVQGGATVLDLLQNLNALGLSTPQLISVFLTLKKQGFLHADVVVL